MPNGETGLIPINFMALAVNSASTDVSSAATSNKIICAQWDFTAATSDQLTFKKGDAFLILEEYQTGWWKARQMVGDQVIIYTLSIGHWLA